MNLNELFIQGGLYNLNSSEAERRKKIEDILLKTRKDNEDNEEDEIIDDEMINQYIRRSDVHFRLTVGGVLRVQPYGLRTVRLGEKVL